MMKIIFTIEFSDKQIPLTEVYDALLKRDLIYSFMATHRNQRRW